MLTNPPRLTVLIDVMRGQLEARRISGVRSMRPCPVTNDFENRFKSYTYKNFRGGVPYSVPNAPQFNA